jgi:serine/threonine protein kinase
MQGTVDFLSPEQTIDSLIDHRADNWSLGALFLHFLIGLKLNLPGP